MTPKVLAQIRTVPRVGEITTFTLEDLAESWGPNFDDDVTGFNNLIALIDEVYRMAEEDGSGHLADREFKAQIVELLHERLTKLESEGVELNIPSSKRSEVLLPRVFKYLLTDNYSNSYYVAILSKDLDFQVRSEMTKILLVRHFYKAWGEDLDIDIVNTRSEISEYVSNSDYLSEGEDLSRIAQIADHIGVPLTPVMLRTISSVINSHKRLLESKVYNEHWLKKRFEIFLVDLMLWGHYRKFFLNLDDEEVENKDSGNLVEVTSGKISDKLRIFVDKPDCVIQSGHPIDGVQNVYNEDEEVSNEEGDTDSHIVIFDNGGSIIFHEGQLFVNYPPSGVEIYYDGVLMRLAPDDLGNVTLLVHLPGGKLDGSDLTKDLKPTLVAQFQKHRGIVVPEDVQGYEVINEKGISRVTQRGMQVTLVFTDGMKPHIHYIRKDAAK